MGALAVKEKLASGLRDLEAPTRLIEIAALVADWHQESIAANDELASGPYYDGESGLYYNWNRYYDPRIGRYIQFDPVGSTPGLIPLAPVFNRIGMPTKKPTVSSVNFYLTTHGLNNPFAYVNNKPLRYTDPMGLDAEMCSRPFYPYPALFARHCFLRFSGGGSSSFTNNGVGPDAAPDWWPKSCQPTKGDQDDDCLKREMQKCQAGQYDFTGFNCCHCVEQAMRACGQFIPSDRWPNYPINPGPKTGESGADYTP